MLPKDLSSISPSKSASTSEDENSWDELLKGVDKLETSVEYPQGQGENMPRDHKFFGGCARRNIVLCLLITAILLGTIYAVLAVLCGGPTLSSCPFL